LANTVAGLYKRHSAIGTPKKETPSKFTFSNIFSSEKLEKHPTPAAGKKKLKCGISAAFGQKVTKLVFFFSKEKK
jgi:hypothetical protein